MDDFEAWAPPYTDAEILALFRLARWAFQANDRLALDWIATRSARMRAVVAAAQLSPKEEEPSSSAT